MQVPAKQQLRGAQQGRFGIAGLVRLCVGPRAGVERAATLARAHPVARGDGVGGVLLFRQRQVAAVAAGV